MGGDGSLGPVGVVAGGALVLAAVSMVVVVQLGASGRLGPNPWAGVRTRDTMVGPRQWRAAHRAARGPTVLAAAGLALAAGVLMWVRTVEILLGVLVAGGVWTVVWLLVGLIRGEQAARDAARHG